jgi:hypothetical protein
VVGAWWWTPTSPSIRLSSSARRKYGLYTVRNYTIRAIHAGCSEDQVVGMAVDRLGRAAARAGRRSYRLSRRRTPG